MKKIVACAIALGLLASLPALAQHDDRNSENGAADRHAEHGSGGGDRTGHAGQTRSQAVVQHPTQPTASKNMYLPDSGDVRPGPQGGVTRGRDNFGRGNASNNHPAVNPHPGDGIHPSNVLARHSDFKSLRHNIQASRHFRSGNYIPPRGYQSQRWSYGERLPRGYYARNYWIANFVMLDLFSPPPGLVWVRVGNDALLIDQIAGDIVQVRYGVFY